MSEHPPRPPGHGDAIQLGCIAEVVVMSLGMTVRARTAPPRIPGPVQYHPLVKAVLAAFPGAQVVLVRDRPTS